MLPNRGRIIRRLAALSIGLSASGCFVPSGGWTMRAGLDVRCLKKPAAFVELVDTRWDETTRIAEINAIGASAISSSSMVTPAVVSPTTGPHLLEGVSVPPASDPGIAPTAPMAPQPQLPGNPADSATGSDSTREEPGGLPATEEGSVAQTAATAPSQTSAARPPRRPIASRLFSRPR